MPNWCSNTVSVSGDAADISEFKNWLGEGKGLLTKINPTPKQLTETVSGFHGDPEKQKALEAQEKINLEQFGFKNWYDWNIGNWGTKWDLDVDIDDFNTTDTEVLFSFESAWSPPQLAISALATKFNKLTIRHSFFEEGVGFVGYDLYENGEATVEEYNDEYKSDKWKRLASDEFGWEPWPDDDAELEVIEVTETPKSIVDDVSEVIAKFSKETRDRVKKSKKKVETKKTTKKVAKKVIKKKSKKKK
jgi:hypothetical protein